MEIIRTAQELQAKRKTITGSVGFVPTMGALHEGHLSLIKRARQENDTVIVSIFVNPTQFLEGEDLASYPKREAADLKLCERAGVDVVFIPMVEAMYEPDELSIGAPAIRGYILEGAKRPGHFDGMLQIVMKLLNLSGATRAYFGKKDAQQLVLIQQMVRNYFLSVEIIPCEIVRDSDGLALSSRNAYLNDEERHRALCLSRALKKATDLIMGGERRAGIIQNAMLEVLGKEADHTEYAMMVDRDFRPIETLDLGETIVLVAAWIGKTRLIDNLWI